MWQKHHHAMHVYSQINLKYLQFSTENKCISDTSVWTQTYIHTWKGKSQYKSYLFFSKLCSTPWKGVHAWDCVDSQEPEARQPIDPGESQTQLKRKWMKLFLMIFCYSHSLSFARVWARSSAYTSWLCRLVLLWEFQQWELGWCLWLFCLSLEPFSSYWIAHPALIEGFVSSLTASYYAVFTWYPWEACFFLKESGGRVDLGEREYWKWCWEE